MNTYSFLLQLSNRKSCIEQVFLPICIISRSCCFLVCDNVVYGKVFNYKNMGFFTVFGGYITLVGEMPIKIRAIFYLVGGVVMKCESEKTGVVLIGFRIHLQPHQVSVA